MNNLSNSFEQEEAAILEARSFERQYREIYLPWVVKKINQARAVTEVLPEGVQVFFGEIGRAETDS